MPLCTRPYDPRPSSGPSSSPATGQPDPSAMQPREAEADAKPLGPESCGSCRLEKDPTGDPDAALLVTGPVTGPLLPVTLSVTLPVTPPPLLQLRAIHSSEDDSDGESGDSLLASRLQPTRP